MNDRSQESFQRYKQAISEAPVLIIPEFEKYFLVFSYASKHTVAEVLLQNNDRGEENPIAFFSKILRNEELRYSIMEKKSYTLVKALKDFRIYLLHSHIIAFIPCSVVKSILTQPDLKGKRAKWVAVLLEYDIEIKNMKLVEGKGLDKIMTDSHCDSLQLNFLPC